MSDADALRARLIAERERATTPAAVVAAVARIEWFNARDGTECPPEQIPTPADLAAWLPECPADAMSEAGDLLMATYHHPDNLTGAWWNATYYRDTPGPPRDLQPDPADLQPAAWLAARDIQPGMAAYRDGDQWKGAYVVGLAAVHGEWLRAEPCPRHPLAPLVDAWQRRPPDLAGATVSATRDGTNMTRRVQAVSAVRRVGWTLDAEVAGAIVDGEPMAAALPDPSDVFPVRVRRPRRRFRPGEQRTLPLPPAPRLQPDLRLLALHDVSADPESNPVLSGDVLALLTLAHVADRPLILTERDGAALLARDRQGGPRPVQRQHDVPRFWHAAAALRGLLLFDPAGTGRWVPLAHVDVPSVRPVDRVTIGPPEWAQGAGRGKWTLTAEGSAAALARVTAGKQGLAGRVVTGLEYRLAAGWSGRPNTVAPDLRPASARRKGGPGAPVFVPWREVLRFAGDWWDETDPSADKAALLRFNRALDTLRRRGYFAPYPGARGEAPAGDSVEIIERVRGARNRPGGLWVRASARFVEAARLAQLANGAGFERMLLTDYAGLEAPE